MEWGSVVVNGAIAPPGVSTGNRRTPLTYRKPTKPGPKPETLVIPGNREDAVRDALKKEKPPVLAKESPNKQRHPVK